jgi:hypothetical protein
MSSLMQSQCYLLLIDVLQCLRELLQSQLLHLRQQLTVLT